MKEFWRGLVAGALLVAILWVVSWSIAVDRADAAIARADSAATIAVQGFLVQVAEARAAKAQQAVLSRAADSVSALAGRLARVQRPAVIVADSATSAYVADLERENAIYFDAWQRERTARLFADRVTIPTFELVIPAAQTVIAAKDEQIAARDRARRPWCGRKCGVVLGVTGTVALAIALDRVRDALTDPRDGHALHVTALRLRW